MATVQVTDGSSAVTTSSTKNDNGTIVNAGNTVASGPITSVIRVDELADAGAEVVGSKVVANDGTGADTTDRAGVAKAVSGGTLAYNAGATEWVMRGGNVASTIGGVANTILASAGADVAGAFTATRDNINEINSTRRLGTGPQFDVLEPAGTKITPGFTKGSSAGNAQNFVAPSGAGDVATTDEAAAPTRAVPGELTYRFGGPNPQQDDYKAKNVFES